VLLDLAARRFYIFGMVLHPQDVIYLAALLIVSAFGLFLLHRGRRAPLVRLRLSADRLHRDLHVGRAPLRGRPAGPPEARCGAVVGRQAGEEGRQAVRSGSRSACGPASRSSPTSRRRARWRPRCSGFGLGPWETFWILFYGFATYGNAGYMREQVCKYMCP
jgi:hypothetical protein